MAKPEAPGARAPGAPRPATWRRAATGAPRRFPRRAPRGHPRGRWSRERPPFERLTSPAREADRAARRSRPGPCPAARRHGRSRPRSTIFATSSAKNGFPPDAEATRSATSGAEPGSSAVASSRAASPASGRSSIIVTFRAPRPKPGRRSISSGRAVQMHEERDLAELEHRLLDEIEKARRPPNARRRRRRSAGASPARTPIIRRHDWRSDRSCTPSPPSTAARTPATASASSAPAAAQLLGEASSHLVDRGVRRDPRGLADDLAERPERDPAAVRRVAADDHAGLGLLAPKRADQLGGEPGLSDAGLAGDRDELRHPRAGRTAIDEAEQVEVVFAADERRRREAPARAVGADRAGRDEWRPRSPSRPSARAPRVAPGGPLERSASPTRTSPGSAACWRRAAAFTASPVTERSDSRRRREHLAGLDADADREPIVEGFDALDERERGRDRAVGIVAVGARDAERRHDGVADVLLDRAAVLGERVERATSKNAPSRRRSSSGSRLDASSVEPTMSAKTSVAILRSGPLRGLERRAAGGAETAGPRHVRATVVAGSDYGPTVQSEM